LDYFRGDALLAISNIDLELARRIAVELVDTTAHLGRIVEIVPQGGSTLKLFNDYSCEY
jgi:hypothetical protein